VYPLNNNNAQISKASPWRQCNIGRIGHALL